MKNKIAITTNYQKLNKAERKKLSRKVGRALAVAVYLRASTNPQVSDSFDIRDVSNNLKTQINIK